jgi:Cof subfamily protein (haloacid dehalogenase superfamily)
VRSPPLLLALDLDGTVVESRRPVRPAVVDAVKRVQAMGIRVTLVTGRMVGAAQPFTDLFGIDGPVICYQGAVIADARTGRFERETPLANSLALRIYAVAKARGLHVQFYKDDRYYVESENQWSELYAETSGKRPVVVSSLPDTFAGRDSTKVVVVTDPESALALEAEMRELCGNEAYVTRSNPEFVEMLDRRVDKGEALREVCARLGIPAERVVAAGDSYNDLPLLEAAGFAIAMGSAPPELRDKADAVVGDVRDDGLVDAIERYVLR